MKPSIPTSKLLSKFFDKNKINLLYTNMVMKHIMAFLMAMALKGFRAKMVDVAEVSGYHRTTLSHFLCKGKWNEAPLKEFIKTRSLEYVKKISEETGKPMFISIDDTVNKKSKPSSKAERPIEGAEYHFSHLERKQAWGHQAVAVMASCENIALNYDIHWYDKTKQSKIEYVRQLAVSLPEAIGKTYVLTDSWYTCSDLINAFTEKGYHYIGALVTNRIIYPYGEHISITDFVLEVLRKDDFNLVTVKGKQYYTYRYEGKLNDIENAVVVITLPKEGGFNGPHPNPKAINAFLCTDTTLDTVTILEYYSERWCIEIFFEQGKGQLGFNKYQIRTMKGIERFWLLMSLCHLVCCIGLGCAMPFGDGLRLLRRSINEERIAYIYKLAQNNVPLEDIYALCA